MSLYRRPHSAQSHLNYYDSSTKQYRVPQPQQYNKLKNDIFKTFSHHTTAIYDDIKQLTKSSSKYSKRIDNICSKYCIKPLKQKNCFSVNVDSQYIAKNFVRNKSKEKQHKEMKNYMHQEIVLESSKARLSSKRYGTEEFFKITVDNLKKLQTSAANKDDGDNLESKYSNPRTKARSKNRYDNNIIRKASKNTNYESSLQKSGNMKISNEQQQNFKWQKYSHPYLKIYQQSQQQAFENLIQKNNVQMRYDNQYPVLNEAQQWQKHQKDIKNIYTGIKRMRYIQSARQRAKSGRNSVSLSLMINQTTVKNAGQKNSLRYDKQSFYIT